MDRDVAGLIVRLRQLARHASISFAQDGSYSVELRDIGGNPGPGVYRSGSNYDRSFEAVLEEEVVVEGERLARERSPAIKSVVAPVEDRAVEDSPTVISVTDNKGNTWATEHSMPRVEATPAPSITRAEMDALDRLRPSSTPVDATAGFVELRMDPYAPKLTAKRVVRRKVFNAASNLADMEIYINKACDFIAALNESDLIHVSDDWFKGVVTVWYRADEGQ